ncbi:hypothetical protein NWE61_03220 [Mycoplasmopsis felis]|uniref:hypothetical protein n=1 Tax=Mycoplasmopsis felis TaxID=33923 RepID=UPI0021DFD54F|nr:hypothetical protein [Mycoplasmopsis felis]MCU9934168.1 hypothetical protein [Mycoplasmopsis felis]
MGLDRPSKGDVIVCNKNLPYYSDLQLTLFRRKHVSFIFQNYNLLQNLSGYDNVQTGSYLQKDKNLKLDIDKLFSEWIRRSKRQISITNVWRASNNVFLY